MPTNAMPPPVPLPHLPLPLRRRCSGAGIHLIERRRGPLKELPRFDGALLTGDPRADEQSNEPLPGANNPQGDGPDNQRSDAQRIEKKHVKDVLETEDDPTSNEPSQSSNVND